MSQFATHLWDIEMKGNLIDFMALPCHDQLRAPFVTRKMPGSLLESGVQLGLVARLSARKVHLIVWVHYRRDF